MQHGQSLKPPGVQRRALPDRTEIVDNAIMLLIAGAVAYPVNRWLISRGKGHAVIHDHH